MRKKTSSTQSAQRSPHPVENFLVEHRLFLFILFVAGVLRLWHINWGLPQVYEEAIPFHFGLKLWRLGQSPVDYNFFVYPGLTYYVQFALQGIQFLFGYL